MNNNHFIFTLWGCRSPVEPRKQTRQGNIPVQAKKPNSGKYRAKNNYAAERPVLDGMLRISVWKTQKNRN